MSVVMYIDLPGVTTDQYDALNDAMGIASAEDEPDTLLYHGCAKTDDGLVVFDVWRSQEDINDFLANRLGPAAAKLGLPQVTPRCGELYNQIGPR